MVESEAEHANIPVAPAVSAVETGAEGAMDVSLDCGAAEEVAAIPVGTCVGGATSELRELGETIGLDAGCEVRTGADCPPQLAVKAAAVSTASTLSARDFNCPS